MKKFNLAAWAPPGMNLKPGCRFFSVGLSCALLYSFMFFYKFNRALEDLYRYGGVGKKTLIPGAVMPDFCEIADGCLLGFAAAAICMVVLIAYNYAYFRIGSKSIYLMKRLPHSREIHRRSLTLPLLAALICLAASILVLLLYFGVYMIATPKGCLQPHQWQKIWSVIL